MSYYTRMKTKVYSYTYIDVYLYIIKFKQIGFSSEVSLMYKWDKGFQKGKKDLRKITLTEVLQCAVCGAVHELLKSHWAHRCQPSCQSP